MALSSLFLFSFLVSCFEFEFLFCIHWEFVDERYIMWQARKKNKAHTLAEYKFMLRFELCSFVYFVFEPMYYPLQSIIDTYIKA